jgi:ATP-dependent Clp protease ATP-binding subunit ClpX
MDMTKNNKPQAPQYCHICGESEYKVKSKLVQGKHALICRQCATKCVDIFKKEDATDKTKKFELIDVPLPKKIKAFLDEYVCGQDQVKIALSVGVYNHYARIFKQKTFEDKDPLSRVEISKSNILMIGPTGTGKTLLAQTIARMLDVPFAMADATTMTEAGYVGADVESCLQTLIRNADGDVSKAEMGIVFIDELDKIGRKSENPSITRDVSGEGVQSALLKLVDSTIAEVPMAGNRKHPQAEVWKIDTTNILFVCGGSFVGLDQIVKARVRGKGILGFSGDAKADNKETYARVEPEDLVKFGLIPELCGRLPIVCSLTALSHNDLLKVLSQPRNAVTKQYEKLAAMIGIKLSFSSDALEEVVNIAIARNTGARGLRSVLENVMTLIMYEAVPGSEIVVTAKMVSDSFGVMGLVA